MTQLCAAVQMEAAADDQKWISTPRNIYFKQKAKLDGERREKHGARRDLIKVD